MVLHVEKRGLGVLLKFQIWKAHYTVPDVQNQNQYLSTGKGLNVAENKHKITCPHCKEAMRNVHNYINADFNKLIVWYCWHCDYTLMLPCHVVAIKWVKWVKK